MTTTASIYPPKADGRSLADYADDLIRICDDTICDEKLSAHARLIISFTEALAADIPNFRSLVINYETSDYSYEATPSINLTRDAVVSRPKATGDVDQDLTALSKHSAELYRKGEQAAQLIPLAFREWVADNAIEIASANYRTCDFTDGTGVIEIKRAEAGDLSSPFVLTIEHSEYELHQYPTVTFA